MCVHKRQVDTFSEPLIVTLKRLCIVIIFSITFGYMETAVVVYLREIFYPEGFTFPMTMFGKVTESQRLLLIEIGREASIIVLILMCAWLFGRNRHERFAYFMIIFAVCDIFYYVWSKVLINWPASIMDWDIPFLIPMVWASPVFYRVLISMTMLVLAVVILCCSCLSHPIRTTFLDWFAFLLSSLIVIEAFCIAGLNASEKDHTFYFPRWLFTTGYLFGVAMFLICLFKSRLKTLPLRKEPDVGFGKPVDVVNRIMPKIIRYRKGQKSVLGVTIAEDHVVKRLGAEGALITIVTPGSAADKAGLCPTRCDTQGKFVLGDLIVAINNKTVRKSGDLFQILDSQNVGDTVRLRVHRQGGDVDLDVKLQARP